MSTASTFKRQCKSLDASKMRRGDKVEMREDQISLTFPDGHKLFMSVHSALNSKTDELVEPDLVELTDWVPGRLSNKLAARWEGVKLWRIGEATSACGTWHVGIAVELPGLETKWRPGRGQEYRDERREVLLFLTNLGLDAASAEGHAVTTISGASFALSYFTADDKAVMTEAFRPNEGGGWVYIGDEQCGQGSDLTFENGSQTAVSLLDMDDLKYAARKAGRGASIELRFVVEYNLAETVRMPLASLNTIPLDIIVSNLSLRDVLYLLQATPALRAQLDSVHRVASSRLRSALRPYFPDLAGFDSLLRKTGSILGGSTMLHVLRPGNWVPADVDIVDTGKKASTQYPQGAPIAGFQFVPYKKGDLNVDVIAPARLVPVDFIMTYHSTPIMNYYSPGELVCLFPHLTFQGKLLRNAFTPTDKIDDSLAKIKRRGYTPLKRVVSSRNGPSVAITLIQETLKKRPKDAVRDTSHSNHVHGWLMTRGMLPDPVWRVGATLA